MTYIPTRSAALGRLDSFIPHAAKYAGTRNFDMGAGHHKGVSGLSPYIRTRLVTEQECTQASLSKFSASAAEKFLQEIAWRTYWKGWLEMRPDVWHVYTRTDLETLKNRYYPTAIAGQTGIDCFDVWAQELTETGYLHNHARMWFASIWIFTLRLPWQLGADFFMQNLLDADAASNTLSWRWVAGLHTQGKHYLARAENITKFTNGRFHPTKLNEKAEPIPPDYSFERQALNLPSETPPKGRVGHLLLPDDLSSAPEKFGEIHSTAGFMPPCLETTPKVSQFLNGALNDALTRNQGTRLNGDFSHALQQWATSEKLDSIILSQPTVGLSKDFLMAQKSSFPLHYYVHEWDRKLWPHATAGFFKLKSALPKIHHALTPLRANDLFPDI